MFYFPIPAFVQFELIVEGYVVNRVDKKYPEMNSIEKINRYINLSKNDRLIKNLRDSSKFSFNKNNLIEYTLEDILDYLNIQLESYETYKKMNEVQEEAAKEAKNHKNLKRLLNYGVTIEEVLEAIGFTDLR